MRKRGVDDRMESKNNLGEGRLGWTVGGGVKSLPSSKLATKYVLIDR